nr:immunoglobulin heavy chain junction region [Macaca mulatta]MOV55908.1 immunoglobulin heavy chain junction region [Macaca mulatta]MOV56048.1 immunoglobulin heavy chain junction region [Macaca mulatta]MOV58196.1 immunoglobulin heavy chain junction region [Macaca mulatta]MOV59439.1 immunoglobulin heavy chain junction region [Macaca mulatta]
CARDDYGSLCDYW